MLRSILFVTDGSRTSKSALSVACSIASLAEAKLYGLYVEDEQRCFRFECNAEAGPEGNNRVLALEPLFGEKLVELKDRAHKKSALILTQLGEPCCDTKESSSIVEGQELAAACVIDASKWVDLVVMGTHGSHTGIANARPRENTRELLYETATPVLVVPDEVSGSSQIVVAYDGNRAAHRALRFAAEFAELVGMSLAVLTVSDDWEISERIQRPALEYLEAYDVNVISVIRVGTVSEQIFGYLSECDSSILALGSFSSQISRESPFGNTTTELLDRSQSATLLVA